MKQGHKKQVSLTSKGTDTMAWQDLSSFTFSLYD